MSNIYNISQQKQVIMLHKPEKLFETVRIYIQIMHMLKILYIYIYI